VAIYFFIWHGLFFSAIAGVSALATKLLVRHLNNYDVPNDRSSHTRITPRGGGLAIVVAYLLGIAMIQLIGDKTPIDTPHFSGFLAGAFLIAIVSLVDDFRGVSFKIKLAGFVLAILVAMFSGIVIDLIHLPVLGEMQWGWWAYPLTLLWIMGLTNAYNFMDGLDGLAASTATIAALFMAIISFGQGSHFIYLASLALAGASLGFLRYNWSPARIFMGDVGSTFLGFSFAVMAVLAARYDHGHTSLLVMPLLLFHFIFDTGFTFLRRLQKGEHVFTAHRSHLYQLLNRLGYTHKKVALIYAAMASSQGLAALWMVTLPAERQLFVYLPFLFFYLFFAAWVLHRAKEFV
jgi:UDP-GlcNAc:undecaprenyl-phosphate/decaprenyl-phosphate GlcNAc-1-phosphate transferase